MAVPNSIADLSVTPASNSPAGSEARSSADDYLRTLSAFVRQSLTSGSDIASATTITPDATHNSYNVTGTTTITTIATTNGYAGRLVWITFTGALILTHNASTMILPGGANITTAANDHAIFRQIGANAQECVAYTKASGLAIVAPTLTSLDPNWSFDAGHRLVNGGNTQSSFRAVTGSGGSAAVIIFTSETYDVGSNYDTATGVFTCPVAGDYFFAFSVGSSALAAGHADVALRKNGAVICPASGDKDAFGDALDITGSCTIKCAANDTIDVFCVLLDGGLSVLGGKTGNFFGGRLLG